jgi:hypothetical protein
MTLYPQSRRYWAIGIRTKMSSSTTRIVCWISRSSNPLYGVIAREAARILKPGGSVLCYCRHGHIGEIMKLMSAYLRYFWICSVVDGEHGVPR